MCFASRIALNRRRNGLAAKTGSITANHSTMATQGLDRSDPESDHGELVLPCAADSYNDCCPVRLVPGFAFFDFSALRFIVAVITGLAFVLTADLNRVSGASG
jgi:hypothetical protein